MAEFLKGLVKGAPSLDRVNIIGLIVAILGMLMNIVSGPLSRKFFSKDPETGKLVVKLAGFVVCIIGFAIAVII